jgi:pimeloyl-ACP methyl ester carboxylesterase
VDYACSGLSRVDPAWLVRRPVGPHIGADMSAPSADHARAEWLDLDLTIEYGKDNIVMRQAAASTPLDPMPLAVLAHARAFDVAEGAEGLSSDTLGPVLRAANKDMATLVPNARFFVAKYSGHGIHQDQPELVTEAIRQVVTGVRDRATWYDLASCCAK